MTDYCSSTLQQNGYPRKYRCPVNGREYSGVSMTTIEQHIKSPWNWQSKSQGYYFCDDPDCDVVYFGEDGLVINKQSLRTPVGVKEKSVSAPVCYCYGISLREASTNLDAKAFVLQKTKEHSCACEIRNPSGRCCLKDFPSS